MGEATIRTRYTRGKRTTWGHQKRENLQMEAIPEAKPGEGITGGSRNNGNYDRRKLFEEEAKTEVAKQGKLQPVKLQQWKIQRG